MLLALDCRRRHDWGPLNQHDGQTPASSTKVRFPYAGSVVGKLRGDVVHRPNEYWDMGSSKAGRRRARSSLLEIADSSSPAAKPAARAVSIESDAIRINNQSIPTLR